MGKKIAISVILQTVGQRFAIDLSMANLAIECHRLFSSHSYSTLMLYPPFLIKISDRNAFCRSLYKAKQGSLISPVSFSLLEEYKAPRVFSLH